MLGLFCQDKEDTSLFQENNKEESGLGLMPAESQNSGLGINVCVNSEEPGKFYADAITKGNHIFLSAGAEGLLRHEMGHVIQQRRGKVSATRTVADQQLNDSVSLEREADRLGSMIPQQVVSGVLSAAGRGISMQEADGVVQCSKVGGEEENAQCGEDEGKEDIEKIVLELTDSIDRLKKLSTIEESNTSQDENQVRRERFIKSIIETYKRRIIKGLQEKIHKIYPSGSDTFIKGLIQRIESGGYTKMDPNLERHEYFGLPFSGAISSSPQRTEAEDNSQTATGKRRKSKNKKTTMTEAEDNSQTATGLHAYSDSNSEKGILPKAIEPLGYFGDLDKVHILHWKKNNEEKFSTMLPRNMKQGLSRVLFGLADAKANDNNKSPLGEFKMVRAGKTVYPSGDGVKIDKSRLEVLTGGMENLNEKMSLKEIFDEYNPQKKEKHFEDNKERLKKIDVYKDYPKEGDTHHGTTESVGQQGEDGSAGEPVKTG